MKKVRPEKAKCKRPLVVPIRFSEAEADKLNNIMIQYPNSTRTDVIKTKLFKHRGRSVLKMNTVDLIFLSTLKNSISCLLSDAHLGNDIVPHLKDLEKLVNERLGI